MAELADALDLGSSAIGVGVRVPSSAPASESGSVVEHRLAKARVASSNLVFRSKVKYIFIKKMIMNNHLFMFIAKAWWG